MVQRSDGDERLLLISRRTIADRASAAHQLRQLQEGPNLLTYLSCVFVHCGFGKSFCPPVGPPMNSRQQLFKSRRCSTRARSMANVTARFEAVAHRLQGREAQLTKPCNVHDVSALPFAPLRCHTVARTTQGSAQGTSEPHGASLHTCDFVAGLSQRCPARGEGTRSAEPPDCRAGVRRTCLIWQPTRTTGLQSGGSENLPNLATHPNHRTAERGVGEPA